MLHVFAFGSLMFDPELPDRVRAVRPARLVGHQRAFNKASVPRACRAHEVAWATLHVPGGFVRDGRPVSLALGTRPGGEMRGRVLRYDRADAPAVLAALDRREGVFADRPASSQSYLPAQLPVETPDGTVEARVYLSNPGGDWHADDLDLRQTIAVLLRATPRRRPPRAKGVWYLLETWETLQQAGIVDAHIEALVDTLRRSDGPWLAALRQDGAPV